VNLDDISTGLRRRFDERMQARERALPPPGRRSGRAANAIRAIHRGELDLAHGLMDEARAAIDDGLQAVRDNPEIRFRRLLQDAQKEYAEARITEAVVIGAPQLPTPEELGVEDAPYLNGMAEAIVRRAGTSSTCCATARSPRARRSCPRWTTCTRCSSRWTTRTRSPRTSDARPTSRGA